MAQLVGKFGPRAYALAAFALVIIGALLRLAKYSLNRSLWYDEAQLALNIVDRSYAELTQPLSYAQGAPIGFLFVQKFAIEAFGNHDYILRLFPLIAGIALLILAYELAKRLLSPAATLVAIGLLALGGKLIYYSSENKQYESDALIALAVLFLGYRYLRSPSAGSLAIISVGGAAALWFSHPAAFMLTGVAAGVLRDCLGARDPQKWRHLLVACLAWTASFVLLYAVSLRFLVADPALTGYWQNAFMPHSLAAIHWTIEALLAMFVNPIGLTNPLVAAMAMALFLIGCGSMLRKDASIGLMLIVPILAVLLACALQKYPFSQRMLLFLLPSIALLVGEGLEKVHAWIADGSRRAANLFALFLTVICLSLPALGDVGELVNPGMGEHIKPVLAHLQQRKQAGDFVYVFYGAAPAFSYYAPSYELRAADYHIGPVSRQDPRAYLEDLRGFTSHGRVWLVFAHACTWCPLDEQAYVLQNLDAWGKRLDAFLAPDASVYLYSFPPAP